MSWFFEYRGANFHAQIKLLKNKMVNSSIELYHKIKQCEALFPTPSRAHYTYNLRDIYKVFQGVTIVNKIPINLNQGYS